jgi:membrane protein DedA with SNARE-associated domain
MAGMSGVSYGRFALYDGIRALLWASLGVASGVLFADRLAALLGSLERIHGVVLYAAAAGLLLFVLMKWWVRRRHGRARITLPEESVATAAEIGLSRRRRV